MKILIVEDEHRIANAIKKGLEQEHFTADVTYTGTDGYDMAASEPYDLLILDLMLPEMSGLEICRKLRAEKNNTPILMLTAKGQVKDKVEGLDAGADDYLTKPFSFEELLARVRALTRRPKTLSTRTLTLENLSLDTNTYEVKRNDEYIELSGKEFALLYYLIRHQKQIVTREQIINNVWDYDANVLNNTIEVYIRNLRKKIDLPFKKDKPLIHTVRGFGYKLGE